MKLLQTKSVSVLIICLLSGIMTHGNAQDVYPGLALYSSGNNAYLYNEKKELVNTWQSEYRAAGAARLMRDSSIVFSGRNPNGWSGGALTGGQFQIITWDGEVIWDITFADNTICPHHNFEIMYYTDDQDEIPNVMAACYEKPDGRTICDRLVELKRTGPTSYEEVWQWAAWDHKTSDPDNHPELLEEPNLRQMGDWNHVNNISYNRELDQLVVDMKSFDEFVIIDHSTTTEEAAGSTGGDYGKGGDILYRWGQASNYGISGSDYIVGFHGGIWIPYVFPGTNLEMPGAGNVMIYHNDRNEAFEIELPGDGDGVYPRNQGEAFSPSSPTWTYDISSAGKHEGSVQRLPNGNTFLYDQGKSMYEVTPAGNIVWTLEGGGNQALKYAYSYLEQSTYTKKKKVKQQVLKVALFSHPKSGNIHISLGAGIANTVVTVFDMTGKKVHSRSVNRDHYIWNVSNQPSGMYIVQVALGDKSVKELVHVIK